MAGFLHRAGPLPRHHGGELRARPAARHDLRDLARHAARPRALATRGQRLRGPALSPRDRRAADRSRRGWRRASADELHRCPDHAERRNHAVRHWPLSRPYRARRRRGSFCREDRDPRQPADRHAARHSALAAPHARARRLLTRHRSFVLFWCARTFTNGAYMMQGVAVGWQIYELTNDPFDLGLVGLMQFIPILVLSVLIGQIADRFDRRLVVGACQIGKALAAFTLALGTTAVYATCTAVFIAAGVLISMVRLAPPADAHAAERKPISWQTVFAGFSYIR